MDGGRGDDEEENKNVRDVCLFWRPEAETERGERLFEREARSPYLHACSRRPSLRARDWF